MWSKFASHIQDANRSWRRWPCIASNVKTRKKMQVQWETCRLVGHLKYSMITRMITDAKQEFAFQRSLTILNEVCLPVWLVKRLQEIFHTQDSLSEFVEVAMTNSLYGISWMKKNLELKSWRLRNYKNCWFIIRDIFIHEICKEFFILQKRFRKFEIKTDENVY